MAQLPTGKNNRYREYLQSELEGAGLFNTLAEAEKDPQRSQLFRDLAQNEIKHAAHWAERIGAPAKDSLQPVVTFRTKVLGWLARRFGLRAVAPFLLQEEVREFDKYHGEGDASTLAREERNAVRLFSLVDEGPLHHRRERWHRTGGGGSLRAAVLGVNDGLVSNFSLTMGVAAGTQNPQIVLLAGVAALLAGSFSMAAGEYVSMSAQRELYEHQIRLERTELEEMPEEEEEELVLIYRAKGLSELDAQRVAHQLMSDPEMALRTKAFEEMGLSDEALGSPWGATVSSFLAFAIGAVVPLFPYLVGAGGIAFSLSAGLSALALVTVGAALALLSGRSALRSALRMLLVGGAAAAITYGVGRLLGVAVS
ncbi:MAG: rubrerythrin family protein [Dehalococcoidia bacterium]|nr:rubrerythrin family protein [Dehalococcoidia bacterium]